MIDAIMRAGVQVLISLRYRVRIVGLNEIARRGTRGILFLANHPALIDPVIVMAWLQQRFAPRALADKDQIDRPLVGWLARRIGVRPIPDMTKYGAAARDEIRDAIKQCASLVSSDEIRAIGVTCQRETFVLLDATGTPIRPAILWYDSRATAELEQLRQQLGDTAYHQRTGKQLDITSAVAKMMWLRRNEPQNARNVHRFADVLAYLSQGLTGNLRTPYSGVDTTGLVDLRTHDWVGEHLDICGLDVHQMPALIPPCSPLGTLTPRAAERCGLRNATPVIAAGGDGHCFTLAATLCEPDAATLTLGTSAVLGLTHSEPVTSEAFRTLVACSPGRYVMESVIQCGSATLSWLDQRFIGAECPSLRTADAREQAVADVSPGCDGLLVLPYWRGARVPHNDPLARGVAIGWTDTHTIAHFRRAVMEGMAFEFAQLRQLLDQATGRTSTSLVVGGGGARSDTWCRILADVLDTRVIRPETVELSSLGAALCAVTACAGRSDPHRAAPKLKLSRTVFEPSAENAAQYAELARAYTRIYHSTRDICHHLSGTTSRKEGK